MTTQALGQLWVTCPGSCTGGAPRPGETRRGPTYRLPFPCGPEGVTWRNDVDGPSQPLPAAGRAGQDVGPPQHGRTSQALADGSAVVVLWVEVGAWPQIPRSRRSPRVPVQTSDEHGVMCPGQSKAHQERWSEAKHRLRVATLWAWQRDPQRDGQPASSRASVGGHTGSAPQPSPILSPGSLGGLGHWLTGTWL